MKKKISLLPCPFCGAKAEADPLLMNPNDYVFCSKCDSAKRGGVAGWNKRTESKQLKKWIECAERLAACLRGLNLATGPCVDALLKLGVLHKKRQ